MDQIIDQFDGKYRFLSNFYVRDFTYQGRVYSSAEAAFQAQKCPSRVEEFLSLTPAQAKRLGRRVKLRPDWEDIKDEIMHEIVKTKFSEPRMAKRLLGTGDAILIEGNTWGDTYWGMVDGLGENRLGKILMVIREELRG